MSKPRLDPDTLRALIEEAQSNMSLSKESGHADTVEIYRTRASWLQAKLDEQPKEQTLVNANMVYIYSAQHGAYWLPNGHGYTNDKSEAWITTREEALARTGHCGPEKMIELLPATPRSIPTPALPSELAAALAEWRACDGECTSASRKLAAAYDRWKEQR
jgi:hypothetical protein